MLTRPEGWPDLYPYYVGAQEDPEATAYNIMAVANPDRPPTTIFYYPITDGNGHFPHGWDVVTDRLG